MHLSAGEGKGLTLITKEVTVYCVANVYGKNQSFIHEIVKKDKKVLVCVFRPETASAMDTVLGNCLVKTAKTSG